MTIVAAGAIIFIPAALTADAVARYVHYCNRRGYQVNAITRDRSAALRAVTTGNASVAVMASNTGPALADERDGDTTDLSRFQPRRRKPTNRYRGAAVSVSADVVREVVDGNGPVPYGIDPETIAAARRIARKLAG